MSLSSRSLHSAQTWSGAVLGGQLVAGSAFALLVVLSLLAEFGSSLNTRGVVGSVVAVVTALWGQVVGWGLLITMIRLLRKALTPQSRVVQRIAMQEIAYGSSVTAISLVAWMMLPAQPESHEAAWLGLHLLGHGALVVHGLALFVDRQRRMGSAPEPAHAELVG